MIHESQSAMTSESVHLTEDEAALYDRQIRLWGLDAQKRLRSAQILLVGIQGLGGEIAKNIVLAGVKSLTLLDHTNVSEEDRCSNFLVDYNDVGLNRAESALNRTIQLNPMVNVKADTDDITTKPDEFFAQFDVVCITGCTLGISARVNNVCRRKNIKFFMGDIFGYYGYMFADLGKHEYAKDVPSFVKHEVGRTGQNPSVEKTTVVIKKVAEFVPLSKAVKFDWTTDMAKKKLKRTPSTYFITRVILKFQEKFSRRCSTSTLSDDQRELLIVRDEVMEKMGLPPHTVSDEFTRYCFSQLGPVCAIVGGVLSQEIIKAVSQKDEPHNNFFFYNGVDGNGIVDQIGK